MQCGPCLLQSLAKSKGKHYKAKQQRMYLAERRMPALLEQINKPAEADWIDLEKIHQDTASNGFLLNRQQLQAWFDQGGWVMAGRFNDRLIGALLAKQTEQGIELSQAGVRTITQRRGVMHQL